jgi:hypothetical protein
MASRAFILVIFIFSLNICQAQNFIRSADLFPVSKSIPGSGELNIQQDPALDTLVSRYIIANRQLKGGMEGFRIQIYRSSTRTARDESNKIRADFMVQFPEIPSYAEYAEPGYFLVRAGDFRTKMEGTKWLYQIRKKYPNAYMVPCIINFPDQIKN